MLVETGHRNTGPSIVQAVLCLCLSLDFGPSIQAAEPNHVSLAAQVIDELLDTLLAHGQTVPAEPCTEEIFLRRAYLDLLGRIPRVSEARDFLDDPDPNRRQALIRRLVRHPSHATRLANVWRLFLLPLDAAQTTAINSAGFEAWLRARFAENVSYRQIVRELLLAEGHVADTGPALYYTAWELQPEKLAGSSARALLGIQIQCAECHDHPFDHWTQRDFWSYAAFFGQLQPLNRGDGRGFRESLEMQMRIPTTGDVVAPRFPGGGPADNPHRSRRQQLADWITADDNPFLAEATVNRVWFMLFGRGLVDPPDDMGKHNRSTYEPLLHRIAAEFRNHHFDMRWLVETLCSTRAYQRSTNASAAAQSPEEIPLMHVKVMTAEQLYDSIYVALCHHHDNTERGPTFGSNRVTDTTRRQFLSQFRSPTIAVTDYRLGIAQALALLNGHVTEVEPSLRQSPLVGALQAPFLTDRDRLDLVYLALYARYPRDEERQFLQNLLPAPNVSAKNHATQVPPDLWSDLLWAMLNSGEFILNR